MLWVVGVWDLGLGVWGLGVLEAWGFGVRGLRVGRILGFQGFGFRENAGFRVLGFRA